jgi:hypothetical protein
MSSDQSRYQGPPTGRWDYMKEFQVECPKCGKDAIIIVDAGVWNRGKLTCRNCMHSEKSIDRKAKYRSIGGAVDPIFGLPLWFQTEVRGDLFWACNREHLNEIRSYVSSRLRERRTTLFATMVEKLPHFIKDSKNRETIIKAIEKLERK